MTKSELINLIEEAGFEAVERTTVYNRVARPFQLNIKPLVVKVFLIAFALLSSVGVATAQDPPPTLARDHLLGPVKSLEGGIVNYVHDQGKARRRRAPDLSKTELR